MKREGVLPSLLPRGGPRFYQVSDHDKHFKGVMTFLVDDGLTVIAPGACAEFGFAGEPHGLDHNVSQLPERRITAGFLNGDLHPCRSSGDYHIDHLCCLCHVLPPYLLGLPFQAGSL